MDLIKCIKVGNLTARLLDSCLRYEAKSNRSETKNIKLINICLEISKISIALCQRLKFLQEAYNTFIY